MKIKARLLIPFSSLPALIDRDADACLALVEQGRLVAFNIASRKARRRHLVVSGESVAAWQRGAEPSVAAAAVINAALPPGRVTISPANLARLFVTSRSHVENLIHSRELKTIATGRKAGIGLVIVPSLREFLLRAAQRV